MIFTNNLTKACSPGNVDEDSLPFDRLQESLRPHPKVPRQLVDRIPLAKYIPFQ